MAELPPEWSQLLPEYRLGRVLSTSLLDGGMFARPCLLTTDSGRYVLRRHTFRADARRFRFQAEVLSAASTRGVICPRVVPDGTGRWGRRVDSSFAAVHEYLAGRCTPWPEWQQRKAVPGFLRALGGRIAAVHDVLSHVTPGGDAALPRELPPIQYVHIRRQLAHWQTQIERLSACPSVPARETRRVFLSAGGVISAYWDLLVAAVSRLGIRSLPRQVVHGDISPVNLVFSGPADTMGLIDWDCTHRGHRLYDALGDVLLRPPWQQAVDGDSELDEIREYVAGYSQSTTRPLTQQEQACVPVFCIARQLEDLRQRLAVLPCLPQTRDAEYAALIHGRLRIMKRLEPYADGRTPWM